jgi:hypothetical protein
LKKKKTARAATPAAPTSAPGEMGAKRRLSAAVIPRSEVGAGAGATFSGGLLMLAGTPQPY